MPQYFFVAVAAAPSRAARSRPCGTIDEALRGAKFVLANGAASAWIVDGDGALVLPAAQVKSRLEALDGANCSSAQREVLTEPGLNPLGPCLVSVSSPSAFSAPQSKSK